MKTTTATQKMHTTIDRMLSAYARDHGLNVRIATPVHGDAGIVAYELLDDATQSRHVVPVVALMQAYDRPPMFSADVDEARFILDMMRQEARQ